MDYTRKDMIEANNDHNNMVRESIINTPIEEVLEYFHEPNGILAEKTDTLLIKINSMHPMELHMLTRTYNLSLPNLPSVTNGADEQVVSKYYLLVGIIEAALIIKGNSSL